MTGGRAWQAYGDAVLRRLVLVSLPHEHEQADELPVGTEEASFDPVLLEDGVFADLCTRARLATAEAQILALLAAVEVSGVQQRLVAVLHGEAHRVRLTLGLLAAAFPEGHPGALALAPTAALRRTGLVVVAEEGAWASREVWVHETVVWALLGGGSAAPDLPPGGRLEVVDLGHARTGTLRLCSGGDRESRAMALALVAGGPGQLRLRDEDSETVWSAVVRAATLHGWSLCVEVEDGISAALSSAIRRTPHLAWGLSSRSELALGDLPEVPWEQVEVLPPPDRQEQEQLPVRPPAGVRLDREQMRLLALARGPSAQIGTRRLAGGHLDRVTRRLRPRRTWDDLVLPAPLSAQVRGLVQRFRARELVYDQWGFSGAPSRGTVALFTGPSGTGKTITAEVIAGELDLDLYVLDLSAVVSKYIGETEKNLTSLFAAAGAGDAVLFFDEADALFGKRSAVSDAKDRYANTEVAHLLQELERYDGLVLLATNLPSNIDDAFSRRLHARLDFALPDEAQRLLLWRRAFPPQCPLLDVDLEAWSREVELSGGSITNAALAAAFAAAGAGEPVTDARLHSAVVDEFVKQGRLAPRTPGSSVRAAS